MLFIKTAIGYGVFSLIVVYLVSRKLQASCFVSSVRFLGVLITLALVTAAFKLLFKEHLFLSNKDYPQRRTCL